MRRGAAATVLAFLVAVAGFIWLYDKGVVRLSYPSPGDYPVRGIDVSHHQGPIHWPSVARDDVQFAYIKVSEGGDHRDRNFQRNIRGAQRVGLPLGAYHFFTLCRSGREQAENFLAAVRGYRFRLPPAVDLEFDGNCEARPTQAEFDRELGAYLRELRRRTGREPVLYVTRDFHAEYVAASRFRRQPLWVRDLIAGLDRPTRGRVMFWQFAVRGRVDGIQGPVDLNVYIGSEGAFRAAIGGGG
jgi:lysozyme